MRHKTFVAAVGGVLAVLPAVWASGGTSDWSATPAAERTRDIPLVEGFDPKLVAVSVDGSLPRPAAVQEPLPAYELPSGPLGIPGTALAAYRNAADIMAREMPGCHIDWALIASIGRIESNHARGGYVDKAGNTLEPILGPELNGTNDTAAIPDTDGGRWDHDTVWDRAVGPTQFIPSTWLFYGADGNGDGVSDPDNVFDATLATGRYLCSGGLDLANPDQLRSAIYRYNNSDVYVDTVILWAEAYRNGVSLLPDSTVPIGAPSMPAQPAAPPVSVAPTPPPVSAANAPTSATPTPTGSNPVTVTTPPTTTTTTTTPPTCESPTSTTTTTTTTTTTSATPNPCDPTTTTTTSSVTPTP
ncbi:lytic transglycosylase domain-containing protein [Amycolatopsis sp.]|uniref:lytic transglycosylase domain-containing protein n=1 Tax=Amycolatopsis sp. TaxID=37632 RepID=UPI002D05FAC2|nr:lytic murein transglycosylase [Amycolatopsis sp.]HVV11016.1 lytic murein transglycosylase [Amycolatopsis sp.]